MPDVVVVGGGLAGSWAAATAAREGISVTLVRRGPGATAVSSGAVDFVPPPEADRPQDWLDGLPSHAAGHPYAVGEVPRLADLEDEAAALGAALTNAGLPMDVSLRRPAQLAAVTGQVRPVGMAQATQMAGDLRSGDRRAVAVAGIAGYRGLDAPFVARALGPAATRTPVRALVLPPPPGVDGLAAGGLDDAGLAAAVEARGGAEALGAALADALRGTTPVGTVLLPPVLGLEDAASTAGRVSDAAGVPVAEMLAPPPSVPGWRLHVACRRLVAAAAVETVEDAVAGVHLDTGGVIRLRLAGGARLDCRALVLATGKYVGGGLTLDRIAREPLLDLPVAVDGTAAAALTPRDLVDRTRFHDQPFLAAGVRTDAAGRPLDLFGRPVAPNLFACGALCAAIDTALTGGGLGVAAWTAARAARAAAAVVAGVRA